MSLAGIRFCTFTTVRRAGLLGLLAAALWPAAQSAVQEGQNFKDWKVQCDVVDTQSGEKRCHLFQNITLKDSGEIVMQIAIGYLPNDNNALALITLPLGIALEPGINVEIDKRPAKKAAFKRCEQAGCIVGFVVDKNLLAKFLAGSKLYVTYHDASNRPIEVPASLQGITAGLSALRR